MQNAGHSITMAIFFAAENVFMTYNTNEYQNQSQNIEAEYLAFQIVAVQRQSKRSYS